MRKGFRVVLRVLCVFVVSPLLARPVAEELPPVLKNYKPVTARRLLHPEPGNWLMVRRTYDGWGFSPISQINVRSVTRLKQVWTVETGEMRVHESAPIVNNGVMFV